MKTATIREAKNAIAAAEARIAETLNGELATLAAMGFDVSCAIKSEDMVAKRSQGIRDVYRVSIEARL